MTRESWVPQEPLGFLVYPVPLDRMDCQGFLAPKENLVELLLRVKEVPLGIQACQVSQGIGGLWALWVLALQAR